MTEQKARRGSVLLIVADDWGYSERFNEGILLAAREGAIDAAGAMVLREACVAAPLLETGVDVGLHLELEDGAGGEEVALQLGRFEEIFGRSPDYIDGHHHRHADPAVEPEVIAAAQRLEIRVRAVDERQKDSLRAAGVSCAERLVGRLTGSEEALPPELARHLRGEESLEGLTEWMVHPGRPDPAAGSSLDAAREEDLTLLLELQATEVLAPLREAGRRGLR